MNVGRLFWKFFLFFWFAQVITTLGVGIAIWAEHPDHPAGGPPPPPLLEFQPPPDSHPPPPPPPPPRSLLPPLMPLLAGGIVSLLFAALLAAYFARPLRALRTAFGDVAAGRMGTRVGIAMGSRRDELADLGADFDRMADRLQGLVENQRRLLHDVSHELRSPLARLQAIADLMRQQPERAMELIDRLERDTARMDRLVGELLTLARLDAGLVDGQVEHVDLSALVEDVVSDVRLEAETRGCAVELTLPAGLHVTGNPDLLRRACENVLRNALRHSPPGGRIDIAARLEQGRVCIAIADRGKGVATSDLEAIFAPFHRAAATHSFAGYGLGLAITRHVMQAHNGTVKAENRPDGGLVVTLCLPVEK